MSIETNLEMINAKAVWSELYFIDAVCPNCDVSSILDLNLTIKSIKMVCGTCGHVWFYRSVKLERQ